MRSVQIICVLSLVVAAATAQEADSSHDFVLSRAKRSPQYQYGVASASAGGAGYYNPYSPSPYYQGAYSFNQPQYYRPGSYSHNYNFRPPYSNNGFYPGNGYHNGGYGPLTWMPIVEPQSQHIQEYQPQQQHYEPGVMVWVPLETLEYHIQLERELQLQKQYEQEQLEMLQLQQQAKQIEEQQAAHRHAPLDNHDAVIDTETGSPLLEPAFIPLPLHEDLTPSVQHLGGVLPNQEQMLVLNQYPQMIEPTLMQVQPILTDGNEIEYISPLLLQEALFGSLGTPEAIAAALAQGSIPEAASPVPVPFKQHVVKKSPPTKAPTKRTTMRTTMRTTRRSTTTTEKTTRPPTILKEASINAPPTTLQESKNEVDLLANKPK